MKKRIAVVAFNSYHFLRGWVPNFMQENQGMDITFNRMNLSLETPDAVYFYVTNATMLRGRSIDGHSVWHGAYERDDYEDIMVEVKIRLKVDQHARL